MMYVERIFVILSLFLIILSRQAAGGEPALPHPRSSEIKDKPHSVREVPPQPKQPEARPTPSLPTVPLGYKGKEHKDGTHHGYDGHHNWHLKGRRR